MAAVGAAVAGVVALVMLVWWWSSSCCTSTEALLVLLWLCLFLVAGIVVDKGWRESVVEELLALLVNFSCCMDDEDDGVDDDDGEGAVEAFMAVVIISRIESDGWLFSRSPVRTSAPPIVTAVPPAGVDINGDRVHSDGLVLQPVLSWGVNDCITLLPSPGTRMHSSTNTMQMRRMKKRLQSMTAPQRQFRFRRTTDVVSSI